jgi:hypothetical protein
MTAGEQQAILEQLAQAVAFLCDEVASLVDDRAERTPVGDRGGVLLKAEKIRENARLLRRVTNTAS